MGAGLVRATRAVLENNLSITSAALRAFPRTNMGMVTDEAKATPEYRKARAAYNRAFQALRKFNTTYKP